ncbi:unnamed protein product, partial [Discosporangium mesarthrocarpum]
VEGGCLVSAGGDMGGWRCGKPEEAGTGTGSGAGDRVKECAVWVSSQKEGKMVRLEFIIRRSRGGQMDIHLSFQDAMKSPRCVDAFRRHLHARHASENLDFWEATG